VISKLVLILDCRNSNEFSFRRGQSGLTKPEANVILRNCCEEIRSNSFVRHAAHF